MRKRLLTFGAAVMFLLSVSLGRCGVIMFGDAYSAGNSYNSITVDISTLFTNIYDRNGEKLNNNSRVIKALVKPSEKCIGELPLIFNSENVKAVSAELSKGYPVVKNIDKYASTKYIKLIETVEQNSSDMPCRHLISGDCGGLEAYVNKQIGRLSVNYSVDALGKVLDGDDGEIINDGYDSESGVKISIDKSIQQIAENAAKSIDNGCVVVLDCATSQILASVSRGGDYLNRAVQPYAVGSAFKIVVSACAIENNINLQYTCKSKIKVGDTVYRCQNNHQHGRQKLEAALANSCNCYFVNLALTLGADRLTATAKKLGFAQSFSIYEDFKINSGSFPALRELESKGQLALLGFGQGRLADTPLHFASVICAVANGGYYNFPTLSLADKDNTKKERAVSAEASKKLREYMRTVVQNGTGANADYNGKTAGKTATAQSGIYENGAERLNTWFAGFYPYSAPKYAVVVMREGGTSGSEDCCPVFRTIVENIDNM